MELYLLSPICLLGMVLNKFSTETLTLSQHFSGGTEDNHGRFLFKQLIPHSAFEQGTSNLKYYLMSQIAQDISAWSSHPFKT
jgi:hypothetical protein